MMAGCLAACFNPKKYNDIQPTGLIAVTSGDSTVAADGANGYVIHATILDKDPDPAKKIIVFKTTFGTFANGKDTTWMLIDASRQAGANLNSVNKGTATVTASAQGIVAAKKPTVTFVAAYGDKLTLAVDSFSIKNDNKTGVVLTAKLSSSAGGKPSSGTMVTFTATDSSGLSIGTFLNNVNTAKTDANGQAQIQWAPINTTYSGYVTLSASAANLTGPYSGTTQIFIRK